MNDTSGNTGNPEPEKNYNRPGPRILLPLGLLAIGGVLLFREMGFPVPEWIISWQCLLIAIGIFSGLASGFRGGGWLIMILVGSFFLIDQWIPDMSLHRYLWPIMLIILGLFMLLRPKRPHWGGPWGGWGGCDRRNFRDQRRMFRHHMREARRNRRFDYGHTGFGSSSTGYSSEDFLDITTAFGGIHKNIVSKEFKGGDVTVFMGGIELNLTQADIQGVARLDITQIMGGTKLIVPPHWEIRTQTTSVFGSVEDKRQQQAVTNPDKVLILDGSSVFGGIEIRNF
ncbi:MAG TPA: LiaF domain-containing protein [Puia sp.]|nr:LiaF domain-containing protein [Puia sp.]